MMEPLKPAVFPFFVLILITPEFPAASYFAEGLVIISIWSNEEAGMFFNKLARSAGERKLGFPSSITFTPALPLRLIFPLLSTVTPGDFSNTSSAVAPALVGEASTLTIVLSIFVSINGLFAVTTTSLNPFAVGTNWIVSSWI